MQEPETMSTDWDTSNVIDALAAQQDLDNAVIVDAATPAQKTELVSALRELWLEHFDETKPREQVLARAREALKPFDEVMV